MQQSLRVLSVLALLLAAAGGARYRPESLDPEVKAKIAELPTGFDARLEALRKWPREMRLRYANGIRSFDPELDYNSTEPGAGRIRELLAMGDPVTASYMMDQARKLRSFDVFSALRYWKEPEAVPFLAEFIQSDEPLTEGAVSFTATAMLYALLPDLQELPPQVRAWSRKVLQDSVELYREVRWQHHKGRTALEQRTVGTAEREREILQKWWKANEVKFLARDYGSVTPGEPFEAPSQFLPPMAALAAMREPGPDRDVRVAINHPQTRNAQMGGASAAVDQATGENVVSGSGNGLVWIIAFVAVAIVAAAAVVWRGRTRRLS